MAIKHITFQGGNPTPVVPVLGLLAALSNYETSRLCRVEALAWMLKELFHFAVGAHWNAVTLNLCETWGFLQLLWRAGLCLWHLASLLLGAGIITSLLLGR